MNNNSKIDGDHILDNIKEWLKSKQETDEGKWPHYDYLAAFTRLLHKILMQFIFYLLKCR